jgi:DNA-binding Lrp family transcriptional regulator
MRTTAARETLTTVLDRLEFVDCLLDGPKGKRELAAELSVSRSTVNRAVRDLEALGLVERVDGAYRATELCRTTVADLDELTAAVGRERRLRAFRRWVPDGTVDVDLSGADGRLYLAEAGNPYRMINRHVARIESSSRQRAVLPYVGLHAAETARDAIVDEGGEGEIVLCGDASSVLRTNGEFRRLIREMLETGRFRCHVAAESPPISASEFDGTVQILADEDGEPRALFESTDEAVVRWVERWIDGWIDRAEPVAPADLD